MYSLEEFGVMNFEIEGVCDWKVHRHLFVVTSGHANDILDDLPELTSQVETACSCGHQFFSAVLPLRPCSCPALLCTKASLSSFERRTQIWRSGCVSEMHHDLEIARAASIRSTLAANGLITSIYRLESQDFLICKLRALKSTEFAMLRKSGDTAFWKDVA